MDIIESLLYKEIVVVRQWGNEREHFVYQRIEVWPMANVPFDVSFVIFLRLVIWSWRAILEKSVELNKSDAWRGFVFFLLKPTSVFLRIDGSFPATKSCLIELFTRRCPRVRGSSSGLVFPDSTQICGLSLLLVLFSAARDFSPGTPVFPSPQKPTF